VDVANPDSEFTKLTNKHRSARNLTFASLTSALRRDAHSTRVRRGETASTYVGSPTGTATSWAGQMGGYAGSMTEPTPSEAGSEAPSHAAGRPTPQAPPIFPPGKRVVGLRDQMQDNRITPRLDDQQQFDDTRSTSQWSQASRSPAPFADHQVSMNRPGEGRPSPQVQSSAPFAQGGTYNGEERVRGAPRMQRGTPPFAQGGSFDQGYPRQAPASDTDFLMRRGAPPSSGYRDDRSDVMSQANSDMMSVADSQREEFTMRNRSGHGNILTWGNDSRNITPERKRQGRQLTTDEAGSLRSQASSGIIPASHGW